MVVGGATDVTVDGLGWVADGTWCVEAVDDVEAVVELDPESLVNHQMRAAMRRTHIR
jgi:hypothetical protein